MDESSQTELTNSELPVSQLTVKAQAKPRCQNPLKPSSTKRNRAPPPLEPLPSYEPFKRFPFEAWKPKIAKKSPLQILFHFLDEECIRIIVKGTNSYAASEQFQPQPHNARPWRPLSKGEFLQWLGLRLIMARTIEKSRASYWHDSERLHRHMGKNRWDQIHRFLCINLNSPNASDPWFFKFEPLASCLRLNCSIACIPSSWVTVDESMAGFKGRSIHKVKMPHKPIDEGFKIWCIRYGKGFVCDFLFHSAQSGLEATIKSGLVCTTPLPLKPVSLAPTV